VVGVAAVAAVASYEHVYALVRAHGDAGWTGRLVPLTVDELIYASSMVMLDSARLAASPIIYQFPSCLFRGRPFRGQVGDAVRVGECEAIVVMFCA
jgi:hypothetical protein